MASPEICELAAGAGFDFVIIDMEHGSFGLESAVDMIRAVELKGATPVVRLPDGSISGIKKVLDAGAVGVIVPGIRTGEEARQIAAAVRYEPKGTRGACPYVRATGHGLTDWKQYSDWSDRESMAWALIENADAVRNIEDIAAAGVDGLMLGPFDLSMSMGHQGDIEHPAVTDALNRVVQIASEKGLDFIVVLFGLELHEIKKSADAWRRRGCRIITTLCDRAYLADGYRKTVEGLVDR